jgi:hypothetical protein
MQPTPTHINQDMPPPTPQQSGSSLAFGGEGEAGIGQLLLGKVLQVWKEKNDCFFSLESLSSVKQLS